MYDPSRPWRHDRLDHIPMMPFREPNSDYRSCSTFRVKTNQSETVLYPSDGTDGKRRERMASPLILKPLALADGQAIPLIMQLKATPLDWS